MGFGAGDAGLEDGFEAVMMAGDVQGHLDDFSGEALLAVIFVGYDVFYKTDGAILAGEVWNYHTVAGGNNTAVIDCAKVMNVFIVFYLIFPSLYGLLNGDSFVFYGKLNVKLD
jgi:hypothetical protein